MNNGEWVLPEGTSCKPSPLMGEGLGGGDERWFRPPPRPPPTKRGEGVSVL